jgi:hypothetical protein
MDNPLDDYRRAQRAIRREFDPFTRAHCPTCPQPCCVHPARIAPVDVLLAEATGWRAQVEAVAERDATESSAAAFAAALTGHTTETPAEPCPHLGPQGCTFPDDLRPYGCTAWVCPIMYERLDRRALSRVRRLVRDLDRAHASLMSALRRQGTVADDADTS